MTKKQMIALMVFGDFKSGRNALTEEKYRLLAAAIQDKGFAVSSILYHDAIAGELAQELLIFDAILVWVNPIEQGNDRKILDALLTELSAKGCFVSAHPEIILKIGTKEVLYKTKEMEFGTDVKMYHSFEDFKERFQGSVRSSPIRILKQYRGNGGNGVFKIDTTDIDKNSIVVTNATGGDKNRTLSVDDFFEEFELFFNDNNILIDQEWNQNIINGMVRCYVSGTKVAGFGYQEVNALYPVTEKDSISKLPGKRYYFSEDCGLFRDLKYIMENNWVPGIMEITDIKKEMMPVIWDADFFINKINTGNTNEKYSLCEINVSCVSPFPESSVPFIVENVKHKISSINR